MVGSYTRVFTVEGTIFNSLSNIIHKFILTLLTYVPSLFQFYLSPEDFKKVFGMSLSDYEKMPLWKRSNLKKSVNLY